MADKLSTIKAAIEYQVQSDGPFSHNLVSLFLRQIDKQFGSDVAQKVVLELDLKKRCGITQRNHGWIKPQ